MTGAANMDRPSETRALLPPVRYADALARVDPIEPLCVSTGFADLDSLLGGGFPAGTVSYLLSRPQAGRSMLALQFARVAALAGRGVWFSGHDEEALTISRLRCAQSRVPVRRIRRPDRGDVERLEVADHELCGSELLVGKCLNDADLRLVLGRDRARFQLVVLDGLFQQRSPHTWRPTAAKLKRIAAETGTAALVTLAAPPSPPGHAGPPDPTLAEGPADLIETADFIYSLSRPDELGRGRPKDQGDADLALLLNRHGPIGRLPLYFLAWSARLVAT